MNKLKSAITGAALVAAASGAILTGAAPASATGTAPPWAPGGVSQDGQAVGGLAFFDASGNPITSGSTQGGPFAAYVVGLVSPRSVPDTTATLFAYVPQLGLTPDNWHSNEALGASPSYPNAAAPGALGTTALPLYTPDPADQTLDGLESDFPNASADPNYNNVYEIRLQTGRAGAGVSVTYDYADIKIDNTTHTWSLLFTPDAPSGTATTSTLGSSATAVNQGDTVTLTDTIAPAAAGGTVQFKDGTTNIGAPVSVTGGVATTTDTLTASGAHQITAVYTPAALSGFDASTSNAVIVTAAHVLANTSVALSANPTNAPAFTATTLTATTTPGVAGQVKFFDGGAQIGVANVSAGTASITYSGFAEGPHSVTALFTPTDIADNNPSTSDAVTVTATAATGALPDDQPIQTTVKPGSLAITTPYTADHPLILPDMTLNEAGTQLSTTAAFGDGSIADRSATTDGTGSIQVVDTRAGNANWTASAQSNDLTDGAAGDSINAQNVGLTGLAAVPVSGNALTAASLTLTPNAASDPALAPGVTGSAGLGGVPHAFAATTAGGDGSIGVTGTLTINAPTSTKAGVYTGTITFTVV
jgi:hypothetical protein